MGQQNTRNDYWDGGTMSQFKPGKIVEIYRVIIRLGSLNREHIKIIAAILKAGKNVIQRLHIVRREAGHEHEPFEFNVTDHDLLELGESLRQCSILENVYIESEITHRHEWILMASSYRPGHKLCFESYGRIQRLYLNEETGNVFPVLVAMIQSRTFPLPKELIQILCAHLLSKKAYFS